MLWAAGRVLRRVPVLSSEARLVVSGLRTRFMKLSALSWLEKLSGYFYGVPFFTLLLATHYDHATVGVAALAAELTVRLLSLSLSPSYGLTLPAFATVFAENGEGRRQRLFESALRALALVLAASLVVIVAGATPLVWWLYSPAYAAAVPLLRVLVPLYFAEYAIYPVANAVLLAGEQLREYTVVKIASLMLVPVVVYGAFRLPILGAVAMFGLLRLATALAFLGAAVRAHHLRVPAPFYGRMLLAVVLSTFVGVTAAWLGGDTPPAGIAAGVASLATFVVTIRALRCFGPPEQAALEESRLPGVRWVLKALTP
jgi:O-antigen/teichoic acid export membrane protein